MELNQGSFTRTYGAPEAGRNRPRFFIDTVEDAVASATQGRRIFQDLELVEIIMPGNMLNRPVERVNDAHRQMWPEEYDRFKKGLTLAVNGTPLEEWPRLRPAQVKELKALDLLTVEDIAGMSDHVCQRIGMGGSNLRLLAKAFLDDVERNALTEKLAAEVQQRDLQNVELTNKVNELSALLNQVYGELQALKNAPSAIASHVPGMNDPAEAARMQQHVPQAPSSLDQIAPRPRGRPRKDEAAA